jgi:hypothetical protein
MYGHILSTTGDALRFWFSPPGGFMESNAFLMMSHFLFLCTQIWPIFMLDEFPLYITKKEKGGYGYHTKKMKQQWHTWQFFFQCKFD